MENENGIIALIRHLIAWDGEWESHGRNSYTFYSAYPLVPFGWIDKRTVCEWITINLEDKTITFAFDTDDQYYMKL